MTDREKIKAEVERHLKVCEALSNQYTGVDSEIMQITSAKENAYKSILVFIDSL